jgi:hypothetical protein
MLSMLPALTPSFFPRHRGFTIIALENELQCSSAQLVCGTEGVATTKVRKIVYVDASTSREKESVEVISTMETSVTDEVSKGQMKRANLEVDSESTASITKTGIDNARKIEVVDVMKSGVEETADTISTKETTTTEAIGNEVNAVSKEQLNKANLDVVNEPTARITKASMDNVWEIADVEVLKSREKEVADAISTKETEVAEEFGNASLDMVSISQLNKQIETLHDQIEIIQNCCICFVRKKQVVLQPCLCICVCNECCTNIKKCPMCKKKIKKRWRDVKISC